MIDKEFFVCGVGKKFKTDKNNTKLSNGELDAEMLDIEFCEKFIRYPFDTKEKLWYKGPFTVRQMIARRPQNSIGRAIIVHISRLEARIKQLESELSCPRCGTTEFLCGHNGVGCTSEQN